MELTDSIMRPEFWAAILGAVVGGLIGIAGQLLSFWHARKMRREEEREIEIATGRAALFKTSTILSNFFQLHLHIEEAFRGHGATEGMEPWGFVLPIANIADPVRYTPEELSLVMSLRDDELLDKIMSLDTQHNSFLPVFKLYAELRAQLQTELKPAEIQGSLAHGQLTEIPEEDRPRLYLKMVELNSLILQTRTMAKDYYEEANSGFDLLRDRFNEKYDQNIGARLNEKLAQKLRQATEQENTQAQKVEPSGRDNT